MTDAVKNAVENLKSDAQQMLEFVETDVTDSYHKFDELAGFYNEDATSVNECYIRRIAGIYLINT